MNILPQGDTRFLLSWLTSEAFARLELPVLAVVLPGPEHQAISRHLQEQCRTIDPHGDNILILSAGVGRDAPENWNPAWRSAPENELTRRLEGIRREFDAGCRFGGDGGPLAELMVRLLGLDPRSLPAVFIRVAQGPGASTAFLVPLPVQPPELSARFLIQLSWHAEDLMRGRIRIEDFFARLGWGALRIPAATLEAIDQALENPDASPALGANQAAIEAERVWCFVRACLHPSAGPGNGSELSEDLKDLLRAMGRADLALSLETAEYALGRRDYGTVVRTYGAVLEAVFSASLLHLLRGHKGIGIPRYLDHVDPRAGPVVVAQALLNEPLCDQCGRAEHNAAEVMVPWKAPLLGQGLDAFNLARDKLRIDPSGAQRVANSLRSVARYRNPAAHGVPVSREEAEAVLGLVEEMQLSGQLRALAAVRQSLNSWPDSDLSALARIIPDPRPGYERCLQELETAEQGLREAQQAMHSIREELEHLPAAHARLLEQAGAAQPDLARLAEDSAVRKACGELPGWSELAAAHRAGTEFKDGTQRAEHFVRGHFRSPQLADLARARRAVNPEETRIRSLADVDAAVAQLELLLSQGVIAEIQPSQWRSRLRARLNYWLKCLHARELLTPERIRRLAADWAATLQPRVDAAADTHQAAQHRERQRQSEVACARRRVAAARRGDRLACACGRHG